MITIFLRPNLILQLSIYIYYNHNRRYNQRLTQLVYARFSTKQWRRHRSMIKKLKHVLIRIDMGKT